MLTIVILDVRADAYCWRILLTHQKKKKKKKKKKNNDEDDEEEEEEEEQEEEEEEQEAEEEEEGTYENAYANPNLLIQSCHVMSASKRPQVSSIQDKTPHPVFTPSHKKIT